MQNDRNPIYNGAKSEYPTLYSSVFLGVPYSWLRSVFLAAFRGLHCALLQFEIMESQKRRLSAPARRRKGRRYRKAAIFLGYRSHFHVANCGAKCLPSSGIERRNCRTKPATCNASSEQKSKDSPWRTFLIDRICQGRIWYILTNKIRCYRKDENYETIRNKSEGEVKQPTSVEITCNNMGEDMVASGCFSVHLFYTQQHAMLHE